MVLIRKKKVEFNLLNPNAKKVSVAGNFNNWHVDKLKAKKDRKGQWKASLALAPGRYEYRLVVDGNWQDDPRASMRVSNSVGSQNCILIVK